MYRQMYHGTLATAGPWQALVTFQQFIVLADKEGVVDMTPESIARETTIPIEIIRLGITALEQPDPDSRTPAENGRRIIRLSETRQWGWRITNYEHYRQLRNEEERRDYHRQYWHKRKLKQTQDTQQTQPDSTDAEAVSSKHEEKDRARKRACRLPSDFNLTPERETVCRSEGLDPARIMADFRDYWTAAPKGSKLDWDATWRTWCRNQRKSPEQLAAKRKADQDAMAWDRVKARAEQSGCPLVPREHEPPGIYESRVSDWENSNRGKTYVTGVAELAARMKVQ